MGVRSGVTPAMIARPVWMASQPAGVSTTSPADSDGRYVCAVAAADSYRLVFFARERSSPAVPSRTAAALGSMAP
jgi:hypothetical protein